MGCDVPINLARPHAGFARRHSALESQLGDLAFELGHIGAVTGLPGGVARLAERALCILEAGAEPAVLCAPIDEVVEDGRVLAGLLSEVPDVRLAVPALATPEHLLPGRLVGGRPCSGRQQGELKEIRPATTAKMGSAKPAVTAPR